MKDETTRVIDDQLDRMKTLQREIKDLEKYESSDVTITLASLLERRRSEFDGLYRKFLCLE